MAASRSATLKGLRLATASPLVMLLLLLLLLPGALNAALSHLCPCARPSSQNALLEEHIKSTTTRAAQMSCCGRHLLAAHYPHHHYNDSPRIVWSFKGLEYKVVNGKAQVWSRENSTFREGYCGLETLQSDGLRVGDEGVYSCNVTTSSGASVTKTFSVCLNWNEDTGRPPINSSISEDTLALLREEVTFSCSAFVGRSRCENTYMPHLAWTKELSSGSWVAADGLPYTHVTVSNTKEGVLEGRLTVHSVQTTHFGRYRCTVTNHNGNLTLQVTLRKGVASILRQKGEYRAALVIMVAAVAFLTVAALLWRRCHVAFVLHFRQNKAPPSTDTHRHDVFLIHGDSASGWVWSVLLPALEDSFGYTCFLPERDMCGGDLIIEETAKSVWDCRSVLVVVTPCLLNDPWSAWALHHAMQASLQARTRLLALVLQDLKPPKGLPDTSGILDILRYIKKVPVPLACRSGETKPKEESLATTRHQKDEWALDGDVDFKMLRADTVTCRSRSKSPKNQKVSNMIAGSNMTSRDVQEENKKHKNGGSVIFLEQEDSVEPSSPCSETPFILPLAPAGSRHVPATSLNKKKSWLSTFLRVVCVRDQEEVFWNTLVSWLGPPAAARRQADPLHTHTKT